MKGAGRTRRPVARGILLALVVGSLAVAGCETLRFREAEIAWTDRETIRVGQTALFDSMNLEVTLVAVDAADRATVQAYDAAQGRQRDLGIATGDPVGFGPYRVRLASTTSEDTATVEVSKLAE